MKEIQNKIVFTVNCGGDDNDKITSNIRNCSVHIAIERTFLADGVFPVMYLIYGTEFKCEWK
jgi:hypothetical protein